MIGLKYYNSINGKKRENICPYGIKLKSLIELNIGGLDALRNQHIDN